MSGMGNLAIMVGDVEFDDEVLLSISIPTIVG